MSVNSVEPVVSIPQGHVRLILLSVNDSSFYLQIPLDIIGSLCLKPRKYLVFLGWCILGVEGQLARENDGRGISTTGVLEDQGIYYYVTDDVGGKFSFKLLLSSLQDTDNILMKSSPRQWILRSSGKGRTCVRQPRQPATIFAPGCWSVI